LTTPFDAAIAGITPSTDDNGAEAPSDAAAELEGGNSPEEDERTSGGSDVSAVDKEDAAASPPAANGHGPELANGHARGAQESVAQHAQQTGCPPDAALVDADQAAQPVQRAQTHQDSAAGADVFVEHEPDPAKARALESSLWEVVSLRNHYCPQARHYPMSAFTCLHNYLHRFMTTGAHSYACSGHSKVGSVRSGIGATQHLVPVLYTKLQDYYSAHIFITQLSHLAYSVPQTMTLHPQVAALAGVLDTDLTNRKATSELDIGPLLTASYASLIETELKRRLKQVPVAFWARPPANLFSDDAVANLPGWHLS